MHKEYPNKISTSEQRRRRRAASDTDAGVLWVLRLAFVRARTLVAGTAGADVSRCAVRIGRARGVGAESHGEERRAEAAYLRGDGRASFERPYGLAWLLQLAAELREWDDPHARELLANLKPLEDAAIERLATWLPKLSHPVRSASTIKPRSRLD